MLLVRAERLDRRFLLPPLSGVRCIAAQTALVFSSVGQRFQNHLYLADQKYLNRLLNQRQLRRRPHARFWRMPV